MNTGNVRNSTSSFLRQFYLLPVVCLTLNNKLFHILTALQSFNCVPQLCQVTANRKSISTSLPDIPQLFLEQFVHCHTLCPCRRRADLPQEVSHHGRKNFAICMQQTMKKLHVFKHTYTISYSLVRYSFSTGFPTDKPVLCQH